MSSTNTHIRKSRAQSHCVLYKCLCFMSGGKLLATIFVQYVWRLKLTGLLSDSTSRKTIQKVRFGSGTALLSRIRIQTKTFRNNMMLKHARSTAKCSNRREAVWRKEKNDAHCYQRAKTIYSVGEGPGYSPIYVFFLN